MCTDAVLYGTIKKGKSLQIFPSVYLAIQQQISLCAACDFCSLASTQEWLFLLWERKRPRCTLQEPDFFFPVLVFAFTSRTAPGGSMPHDGNPFNGRAEVRASSASHESQKITAGARGLRGALLHSARQKPAHPSHRVACELLTCPENDLLIQHPPYSSLQNVHQQTASISRLFLPALTP